MPTITLVACYDCAGHFAPKPAPLALGEWPPGDMRVDYCPDCRPRHLAARDQFYAQAQAENRAVCAREGHRTMVSYWLSRGVKVSDEDMAREEWRRCHRCAGVVEASEYQESA